MKRKTWIQRNTLYFAVTAFLSLFLLAQTAFSGEVSCMYCGMTKSKFGHSWVIIEHTDGTLEELCSVHCAAIDMALHTDKGVKKITVGDYNTKKQIDADKAFWVIGGDKMGVMTARAKWAFETKEAADNFIKEHGGRPATFDDVMKAAFEDMYADTLMIQKKRQMMKKK
ncbi:MAG: nitrous oxide reductase accessory protein NosL [Deltaproteobacteria bacterium]|nr:nitrous oxide reductase accessory protein NosL [Deltaproteobacteria bacterium]